MSKLSDEIKQTKPFTSLAAEAALNIQRTADQFARVLAEALKPADISPTQYNALRILQGAGDDGRTCNEIAERMITRDPDVTRLVDRLCDRGLAQRVRSDKDRRIVLVRITPKGRKIIADLAPVFAGMEHKMLGHFSDARLKLLIELLEDARGGNS